MLSCYSFWCFPIILSKTNCLIWRTTKCQDLVCNFFFKVFTQVKLFYFLINFVRPSIPVRQIRLTSIIWWCCLGQIHLWDPPSSWNAWCFGNSKGTNIKRYQYLLHYVQTCSVNPTVVVWQYFCFLTLPCTHMYLHVYM